MTTGGDGLRPVPQSERTFTLWDFTSLWIGLSVCVPSYYLAGSLVTLGMTWSQGIATVILANTVLLIPLTLTAAPGTRYGIPFPVLARAAFGVRGAQIPNVLRALIGCGWFGIETWIGGQAILLLVPSSWYSSLRALPFLDISLVEFACFMVSWTLQMAVLWRGMGAIVTLNKYSSPILVILSVALFSWGFTEAGGISEMLWPVESLPSSDFWALFFPSLTANIGGWSCLAVNIADFARYARSQADQIAGQAGLPIFMGTFAFVGLAVTSASKIVFGAPISDPVLLVGEIARNSNWVVGTIIVLVSSVGIILATITTNIPANVVASANVLVNLNPWLFSFGTASLVTGIIGILFQPWRVFRSSGSFVMSWLEGYASITGPINGILIADYYVVRRMVLDVEELYSWSPKGVYYYWKGYNPVALVALVVSSAPILPGFLVQVGVLKDVGVVLRGIYGVSWFFGFFSAAAVYWVLSSCCRRQGSPEGNGVREKLLD